MFRETDRSVEFHTPFIKVVAAALGGQFGEAMAKNLAKAAVIACNGNVGRHAEGITLWSSIHPS